MLLLALFSCPKPNRAAPKVDVDLSGPMSEYTVQWGDSLWWIAETRAIPGGWRTLHRLNSKRIRHPDEIWVGQKLRVPREADLPDWPEVTPFQGNFASCDVQRLQPPEPRVTGTCQASACVDLGMAEQICSCDTTSGRDGLIYLKHGRPVAERPVSIAPEPGDTFWAVPGTPLDFDVVRVDLDGDGADETVSAFRKTSNDVGQSWWDVTIWGPGEPVSFEVSNYGDGTFITGPDGCQILATEWTLMSRPGQSSMGWYLVARGVDYRRGVLEPLPAPLLARRLLYSYEPGRIGRLGLGTPAADLVVNTEVRNVDPVLAAETVGRAVVPQWDSYRQQILPQTRFGDTETGLIYPPGYQPPLGPGSVETLRTTWSTRTVTWL